VTATVECIPLIAGSIMSKKIAEGIDALVLDVKVGKGAFMKTEDGARRLAETLVGIGRSMGKQVRALITDMNQPLGQAVGNALEVRESLETLKGRGPEDLTTLSVELAAHMVVLGERAASLDKARELVKNLIASGAGLEKFRQLIEAQGGDPLVVDDDDRLPKAALKQEYKAETDGFLLEMDAERIGIASMVLGAGRERVDSPIDHAVGIWLSRKVGDHVARGDVLCTVYYNDEARLKAAAEELRGAFVIGEQDPPKENLIKMVL
jgi:pyrimidine-nucleoside phosphorylase